jgi:DNA-binding SARP family transcriptional activator
MGQLRIKLLGELAICHDTEPILDLSAKAIELFCYLFIYRDRPHTREALAELLWPDVPAKRAQKYLRQTLWQLQSSLGGSQAEGAAPLVIGPGWLRVNVRASWWFDVDMIERTYQLCYEVGGAALSDEQIRAVELAAEIYEGDLLATWQQDWCIYERERLQLSYLAILDCLMSFCETHELYARGVAFGLRILRYDPARESTYNRLMRLYYLAGDRTTALREFERCAAALAREFDLAPTRQTLALHDLIRADCRDDVAAARLVSPVGPAARPGSDVQAQLDHLQSSLATFETHIQQELAGIVQLLRANLETSQQMS